MSAKSRFVWHDFMAADVEAAKKFYGELLGWKFRRGGDDPYEHISAAGQDIGGMLQVAKPGIPPHWIGYISTEKVADTVAAATKNGGKVIVPPTSIPEVGEFAVVADPQGAYFSPFHHTGKDAGKPEPERPAPYTFCWDELLTSDVDASVKFYGTLFGWGAERLEMPGFGGYTLLKRTGEKDQMGADKNAGGVMSRPPGMPVSMWLTYIAVPGTDATAEKVARLGGKVIAPPMDIPNVGRFAGFLDPQGAVFSVLQPMQP